ncbi:MAG: M23 family metallopeptidase [Planctomycetes bacterium]|nr:M23 family metallopeptidase [Planctomycetota bacterium]
MTEPDKQRGFEWWHWAAGFLLAVQVVLFLVPQFRPGSWGWVCWLFGSDRLLWWGMAGLLAIAAAITSAVRRPFWTRRRAIGFGMLLLLACSPSFFRVYPSSYDDAPSEIAFRLPLEGPVTVGWGGATPDVNYHVVAADQRWAYDLVVAKDGRTHRGDGQSLEDYYCYGMDVLAPADGVVRETYIDARDAPIGVLGGYPAGGNQIVLDVAPGQFLFLCHLQPGSIAVEPGDRVVQGQVLARVGNSGNTSEPHLHIHLQDTPMSHLGEGIPLLFHNYRVGDKIIDRGIPRGGITAEGLSGEVIEHVGP